jgi:hypothetical protein
MSKKSIKYFCAHYCPFSNETSRAYDLINNKFKKKYPDVDIEIFWTEDINEENKHEYLNANIKYVPTITNQNYAHIVLSLPPNFEKEGKTDEELNEALLQYIYDQLDNKPEESNNQTIKPVNNELFESSSNDNNLNTKKENKSILEKIFGSLNSDNNIKYIIILVVVFLIILPFLKKNK